MPSKAAHIAAARENQRAIDYLKERMDEHLAWIVTIAFYKALHIVEAVFSADPHGPVDHTDDHRQRNQVLRTHRRYEFLWRNYKPLFDASLIARYLRENENAPSYDVFSTYMDAQVVENTVLNHYLRQVENGAARLLSEPNLLAAPSSRDAAPPSQPPSDASGSPPP